MLDFFFLPCILLESILKRSTMLFMKTSTPCQQCPSPCVSAWLFEEDKKQGKKDSLFTSATQSTYQKGDSIFSLGDPADSLYLIHKGNIKLVNYDSDGREKIVAFFGKGEWIWEGLFLEQPTFPFHGVAMDEVVVCKVPVSIVRNHLKDGRGALSVIEILSKKLHDANERNMILSTTDPKAKIARLFAYRASQFHRDSFSMKLSDIASAVSLRPETVSRKISELLQDGVLEKKGRSAFRICDFDALVEIVNS